MATTECAEEREGVRRSDGEDKMRDDNAANGLGSVSTEWLLTR